MERKLLQKKIKIYLRTGDYILHTVQIRRKYEDDDLEYMESDFLDMSDVLDWLRDAGDFLPLASRIIRKDSIDFITDYERELNGEDV